MYQIERVAASSDLAAVTRRLLNGLPEWFGIAEANDEYVESATRLSGYLARENDDVVGLLLMNRHFPEAAEIHLITVTRDRHRRGIGRALLATAEADLRLEGCRLLQVKTLGESHPDPGYDKSRKFYLASGFLRVEEISDLWDENPCLILVKPL